MNELIKRQKSPLMSYSTLISNCSNCYGLQQSLDIKERQLKSLLARESDLMKIISVSNGKENWKNYRKRIEDLQFKEVKLQNSLDQLTSELQKSERLNAQLSLVREHQQQQIIELKSQVLENEQWSPVDDQYLKMRQSTVNDLEQKIEKLSQIVISEQHRHSQEQKFIQSILHLVKSCHPENQFEEPPSLKKAWKWLKFIIQEYVQLKQSD